MEKKKTNNRFSREVRERAVRMVLEHRGEYATEWAAMVSILLYLDPDIMVFASLAPLAELLDQRQVLLTPHLLEPEPDPQVVIDIEICTLRHGVYNLGFLGVRASGEGRRFIDWWAARLEAH